jgi:hypothetical protein
VPLRISTACQVSFLPPTPPRPQPRLASVVVTRTKQARHASDTTHQTAPFTRDSAPSTSPVTLRRFRSTFPQPRGAPWAGEEPNLHVTLKSGVRFQTQRYCIHGTGTEGATERATLVDSLGSKTPRGRGRETKHRSSPPPDELDHSHHTLTSCCDARAFPWRFLAPARSPPGL